MKLLVPVLSAVLLLPQAGGAARAEGPERSRPVPAAPVPPPPIPPLAREALESGARIAVMAVNRLPIVSLRVLFPLAGSASDPEGRSGLAGLVAKLVQGGAQSEIEKLGASIQASATPDALVVSIFARKKALDSALALAAGMIRTPSFPEAELERVREEALQALDEKRGDPGVPAVQRLDRRIFGGHPYGRAADEAGLKAVSGSDLEAFRASAVAAAPPIVAASGDLSLEELKVLAEKHFGSATIQAPAPDSIPRLSAPGPAADPGGLAIDLIDWPDEKGTHSTLRMGQLSIAKDHPDYVKVLVMNFVLGGFMGRIERSLREERGWAYSARSQVASLKRGGKFMVETSVRIGRTADSIAEILREMRGMQAEPVPEAELDRAKRLLAALWSYRGLETIQDLAGQAGDIELNGLPADYLRVFEARVMAVTPQEVLAAARDYLDPDNIHVVVVGNAGKVYGQLSGLGRVSVYGVDDNPKAPLPAS